MSILKDISATLKDIADISKGVNVKLGKQTSIARLSQEATLQFPIIISRSIDVDTAQSVGKALERHYANMVQIVISLDPVLDLKKDPNMAAYLKRRIHQNNPTVIDAIELEESCMNVYNDELLECVVVFSVNNGSNGGVKASNKKQMFSVTESLNKLAVNDLYKPEEITLAVAESMLNHYCKENDIILEADVATEKEKKGTITKADIDNASDALELNKVQFKHKIAMDDLNRNFRQQADLREIERNSTLQKKELERAEAEYRSRAQVRLADNDVKKSNELVATTLSVTMMLKDDSSFGGNRNFVIGVKGLLHPVQSNDMVSNLLNGIKSSSKFFNFIRWTTGEISFLKDLLLNIDGIKEDVVKKHSGTTHWFTTLKRRKTLAKVRNLHSKKGILPNASIVCSMEEVAELNEAYGIDLMNPKYVRKLMDQYFLLGFAIVDASQELCYFMFDGEANFQAISFRGLEKENNSKNDFKEIYKMINSGRL